LEVSDCSAVVRNSGRDGSAGEYAPPPMAASARRAASSTGRTCPRVSRSRFGCRFDQGGYQLYAASGETIVVPFVNQTST